MRHIAAELGGCPTWGEAQHLANELPEPLASALREVSCGTAMVLFSARAFVSRIAERDGVSLEEARRRASAFLAILREHVPGRAVEREEELAKVIVEVWRP